jgi:hypothetical protein
LLPVEFDVDAWRKVLLGSGRKPNWKDIAAALVLSLALVSLVLPVPTFASAKPKEKNSSDELTTGDMEDEIPDNSIVMPMLLVPAIVDGRKSHYIFVSYRLVVENQLQVDRVNQRVAWLHDAIMRDVFKSNPISKENPNRLDRKNLEGRIKDICKDILGDDIVQSLHFANVMSENDLRTPPPAPHRGPKRKTGSSGGH